MSTRLMDSLVEELTNKLGDRPFYTLRELTSIGFFGSMPAARKALQEGRFPFVKISPRRFVIPRSVILDYLRSHMSKSKEDLCNLK
jgi:hypothetical protein